MVTANRAFSSLFGSKNLQTCEVCGNVYDKCLEIHMNGEKHIFDSFECAIHALAPRCEHCDCRIIGHGMESDGLFFCCAHCAEQYGMHVFQDRVEYDKEGRPT